MPLFFFDQNMNQISEMFHEVLPIMTHSSCWNHLSSTVSKPVQIVPCRLAVAGARSLTDPSHGLGPDGWSGHHRPTETSAAALDCIKAQFHAPIKDGNIVLIKTMVGPCLVYVLFI